MSWNRFLLGFLLVVLCSYGKSQVTNYWVPIEFSFFLIFMVVRSCRPIPALIYTFLLSLGLDMILQTGQIKGLGAMIQLLLVYGILHLKRNVVPAFQDLFLMGFFAIFYVTNYYINLGLCGMLDVYFPQVNLVQLLFMAFFHTGFFGLLLMIHVRFSRGNT